MKEEEGVAFLKEHEEQGKSVSLGTYQIPLSGSLGLDVD